MKSFIYSIKDIFNITNGCLFDYKVNGYYIASYQRGYKWKSNSEHDQVPVLLLDIYEAFIKAKVTKKNQEYYLQYITVKKTENNLFEVIDGQQRLTTLTLIFNILSSYFGEEDITKSNNIYLVTYARYDEESVNIFDQILQLIKSDSNAEGLKEQDKFYMLQASLTIKVFFELLQKENDDTFKAFLLFLKNNVKLILNKEDEHTSAEEVFANLNDNKVPLTNAYLIKGLLLTKASRVNGNNSAKKHFKEIIDQRAIMGRVWDEMNTWFSKQDVSLFFFGTTQNGMEKMLELISFKVDNQQSSVIETFKSSFISNEIVYKNPFILFNRYHENIITAEDAFNSLTKIKHIYKRLKSWYHDNQLYNLIGYKQVVSNYKAKTNKGFIGTVEALLLEKSNEDVLKTLRDFLLSKILIKEKDFEKLGYSQYKDTFLLLLAINVFPQNDGDIGNFRNYRFDFYAFINQSWSLEHIFPQNPKTSNFNIKDDKIWTIDKINKKIKDLKNVEENKDEIEKYNLLIEEINLNEEIDSDKIDFVFEEMTDLDELGNMALLSGGVNSALSNGFFNTKRKILLRKINQGSFVPKHTIDVFSKMLEVEANIVFDDSLTIWSANDIKAHYASIKKATRLIIEKISAK
jgi:hypothetical protein